MKRRKLYIYNPETDNFERFYPSIVNRIRSLAFILITGIIVGLGLYLLGVWIFEVPEAENLKAENRELHQQYALLTTRIDDSMKMMNEIQARDSNLYRVLLQMEPQRAERTNAAVLALGSPVSMRNINDAMLVSTLRGRIDSLDRNLLHQAISFNTIREVIMNQQEKLNHIPSVLPINVKDFTMSSGYGLRIDPLYNSHKFHAGLDFAAKMGTQVFATADGRVSYADMKTGYGNCVDIDHGYNYVTRYAHLSKVLVPEGKQVKRGELIGLVGTTGKSTGPHLHYEVRYKGEPQNPVNYYFMDLTPEEYDEMIELAENAGHVMD